MAGNASRQNGLKGGGVQGRKWRKTLEKAESYALYRRVVLAKMGPIVDAQVTLACGAYHFMGKTSEGGWVRVTDGETIDRLLACGEGFWRLEQQAADANMSKYLTDQVIGKPTEHLEVSGPGGGAIPVSVIDELHRDT